MPAPTVILNLKYTGLGIARSLKGRGIPVIGLMGSPRQCGRFTRFCTARNSPSSRTDPEGLLAYLLDLGAGLGCSRAEDSPLRQSGKRVKPEIGTGTVRVVGNLGKS